MPLVRVRVSDELMKSIIRRGSPPKVVKEAMDWFLANPEKVAMYDENDRIRKRLISQGLRLSDYEDSD